MVEVRKSVVFCILACSLCFLALHFERSNFLNKASVAMNPLLLLFDRFLAGGLESLGN